MTDTFAEAPQHETTGPSAFSRALTIFEAISALNSSTMWFTFRVEGDLDLDKLRDAWGLVRQAHPVLAAQILPAAAEMLPGMPGFELVLPAEQAPAALVVHSPGTALATHPIRQGSELALVDVVPGDGQAFVSLAVHHAIADGRLGAYWNSLLWSYYTDLVEGAAPTALPHPVPKSPEEILAERGIGREELGPTRAERAAPVELPQPPEADIVRERAQLSAEDTARLRAYAKKTGQTVHGLVAGAIAVAIRQGMDLQPDREASVGLNSPVDLRERLDPPVEIWGGTNVLGFAEAVVAARPDSDPAALGAEVIAQMQEDLESGILQQSFLHIADSFIKEQPKIPQTIATNLGVVPEIRAPRGARVAELFGWVEMDWAPLMALLKATGQEGTPPPLGSMHIISTYLGRLAIDISAAKTPQDARLHAERITNLLLDMAARDLP
ncbi:MAG: phthiocerol/phthiodiolone dimycocerosyl transferase family protein [Segniliparus sp.]|uniref:phthiocerol/phthiodiolone dimycocerosyl transferase family protein n=1 Tax=Segniliparus sp. TaxID=2804064 RepID=UPI003F30F36E